MNIGWTGLSLCREGRILLLPERRSCAFQTKEIRMNSTKDVMENHIRRFREGNIRGVLDDFSPDAIHLTPLECSRVRRNHR